MKSVVILTGLVLAIGAPAAPLSLSCHQDITQTSYTMTGKPIPTQHIAATVHYVLDFDEPSVSVKSQVASAKFTNGAGGQHILIDHEGLVIAGTTRMPNNGPVTSQIIRFSTDGTRATGQRKLLLNGKLLQIADTKMRCVRAG